MPEAEPASHENSRFPGGLIRFCLERKVIVWLLLLLIVAWGVIVAPFDWELAGLPRDPVPVDAIPDIGENQQIVFTEWPGRSPQDVEDQITYPLTSALLGVPGIKTVRSNSMFGFSTIYVIFDEKVDFYWSRTRILEKLNSLPPGTLPAAVRPALGPDATALGQVFWYTLEGLDVNGKPTGGWDLDELRSIQDWQVRYALLAAGGVSEVASVGGFVREYQIDADPDALRIYNVTLGELFASVQRSNKDVGARTIEINRVEYVIRGRGFIQSLKDIENTVIKVADGVPVYVSNVARVTTGPALRRGALDKEGAEVVGGVAVVRYGENPLATIKNIKRKIAEISSGLPSKRLPDGTLSQVRIVPFYDRSGLIYETLGTLNTALFEEIMVTIIVVLIMVMHLRSSLLISATVPLAVLLCFIAMKTFGVDANIVALSGIAIAIGTIVDVGIVICENILRKLDEADAHADRLEVIHAAALEVGGAVMTAVSTTVVSFLPVFTMQAAEGKLFKPLAFTKTFALIGAILVALTIIPPAAHLLFRKEIGPGRLRRMLPALLIGMGVMTAIGLKWWLGLLIVLTGIYYRFEPKSFWQRNLANRLLTAVVVLIVTFRLAQHWLPLGPEKGAWLNFIFVGLLVGIVLGFFYLIMHFYEAMLRWCLNAKALFLMLPLLTVFLGAMIWLGTPAVFGWLPQAVKTGAVFQSFSRRFPGLGKEFMPPLDEGSYLYMPTTMPHASIGEVLEVLQFQDRAIRAIPEVEGVVGKLGRAETSLDPAPVSMIETVINYRPEYIQDENGRRMTFKYDAGGMDYFRDAGGALVAAPDGKPYRVTGKFERDGQTRLIPDENGRPFRLWRPSLSPALNPGREKWGGIASADDIWNAIVDAAQVPGTTSAPKLQPIAARIVMLQSGMRAPMGIKIKGPDLGVIEKTGFEIEQLLKQVPSVEAAAVIADRIVGKPYLEIGIRREAAARYGIKVQDVQDVIEVAVGGKMITMTVEGRQRYPVRVRYLRELRDSIEALENILVAGPGGRQFPIKLLADINIVRGPQVIKSEDTFLVGYVLFDKKPGTAEVDVVRQAQVFLQAKQNSGEFKLPAGVSYTFAGSYENQVRSEKRLMVVLPLAVFIILMILYLQFRSLTTTAMIFTGVIVAWAGGFIMIWLYGLPHFMNFSLFGANLRDLFQMHPINLSIAIWVGFLALFGIASDDGVVMTTYLDQVFGREKPDSISRIREMTIEAGKRRVRPCLMTTATTVLALMPVLTSTGRGSDIMVPMAIPSFGGMLIEVMTMFVLPVLYCAVAEFRWRFGKRVE